MISIVADLEDADRVRNALRPDHSRTEPGNHFTLPRGLERSGNSPGNG